LNSFGSPFKAAVLALQTSWNFGYDVRHEGRHNLAKEA
jgi:hypothetical protein